MLNSIPIYSSPSNNVFRYDVFLNFRGKDTRNTFAGNLHKALRKITDKVFMDDQEIMMGDEITPTITNAIQQSRLSIVIFSEKYASSRFCLEELVMIMECLKRRSMVVLPVFYKVEPHVVRYQMGTYAQALTNHKNKEKMEKWELALSEAANLSGLHVIDHGYEHEYIDKIIQEVHRRINDSLVNYPVVLESPGHKGKSLVGDDGDGVMSIFDVSSNDAAEIMSHVSGKSKNGAQVESRVGVKSNGGVRLLHSVVAVNPTNGVHMEGMSGNGNPTSGYTSGYNSNQNQSQGQISVTQAQNSNELQGSSSVNQSQGPSSTSLGQHSNGYGTNNASLNQSQGLRSMSSGQHSNGFGRYNSYPNQSQGPSSVSQGQNSNGFGTYNWYPNQSQGPTFVSQGQNSSGFGTYNYSTN